MPCSPKCETWRLRMRCWLLGDLRWGIGAEMGDYVGEGGSESWSYHNSSATPGSLPRASYRTCAVGFRIVIPPSLRHIILTLRHLLTSISGFPGSPFGNFAYPAPTRGNDEAASSSFSSVGQEAEVSQNGPVNTKFRHYGHHYPVTCTGSCPGEVSIGLPF